MEPNGDQKLVVGFNWLTLHNQISLSLTQERSRNDQIEKDKNKISNTGTWLQLIDWYESGSLIELLRLWLASRYESEAQWHYMRVVHNTCKKRRGITYYFSVHGSMTSISHLVPTCSFGYQSFSSIILKCHFELGGKIVQILESRWMDLRCIA